MPVPGYMCVTHRFICVPGDEIRPLPLLVKAVQWQSRVDGGQVGVRQRPNFDYASSIRRSSVSAPCLSSGSFRLPHLGL